MKTNIAVVEYTDSHNFLDALSGAGVEAHLASPICGMDLNLYGPGAGGAQQEHFSDHLIAVRTRDSLCLLLEW
jgi:hypothetical protein